MSSTLSKKINNPKQKQYIRAMVQSASPLQLLILMYDGAMQWLNQAIKEIDNNQGADLPNWSEFSTCMNKTSGIVCHLQETLNDQHSPEFAERLFSLYEFLKTEIAVANAKKDKDKIAKMLPIFKDLKEGWKELEKQQKQKQK